MDLFGVSSYKFCILPLIHTSPLQSRRKPKSGKNTETAGHPFRWIMENHCRIPNAIECLSLKTWFSSNLLKMIFLSEPGITIKNLVTLNTNDRIKFYQTNDVVFFLLYFRFTMWKKVFILFLWNSDPSTSYCLALIQKNEIMSFRANQLELFVISLVH